MNPGGNGIAPGGGVAGGPGGLASANPGAVANNPAGAYQGNVANNPAAASPGGVASNYSASGNQAAYQPNGQPPGSTPGTTGVARPEGYINGRPSDGSPPPAPARPEPSSTAAMVPAAPLRPGEWRPSEETNPPKRDPDEAEKEKNEKKKHPYDKVKLDHSQDDWALRNASRHAAAISRPIHVDCYLDRIVLVPEAGSSEPHVIACGNGGRRDADKIVAGVWEIMDGWGMAGREMYWRPVLNFYVAPGAEPRMLDITRSLEGSGLVIERKQ